MSDQNTWQGPEPGDPDAAARRAADFSEAPPPHGVVPPPEQEARLKQMFGDVGRAVLLVSPPLPGPPRRTEYWEALASKLDAFGNKRAAVAPGNLQMIQENQELRFLKKKGRLNFVTRVRPADFPAFATIMALGTRKQAAQPLRLKQRTFDDRVKTWAKGGPEYQRMARLVQGRKNVHRKIVVRLEDSAPASEPNDPPENPVTVHAVLESIATTDARDYPAVRRDLLAVLADQNRQGWPGARAEAIAIIQDELGQQKNGNPAGFRS